MNLYFDLRTRELVTTPGLTDTLDDLTFKAGDTEEIVLQFGTSPATDGPPSVVSAPSWTSENLDSGSLITIGIKESGDYSDGDFLATSSTYTADAVAKTYTFDLNLNTTEINTLLERLDADDTDDVAAIENALFEVTFRNGASGTNYRTSINDVATTIKHDIIGGSEGGATSAVSSGPTELTISSGAVTLTDNNNFFKIDTESDAATDDLNTINGGTDGRRITICAESGDRTVVVKHAGDNIGTPSQADISLSESFFAIDLIYDGANSNWNVIGAP